MAVPLRGNSRRRFKTGRWGAGAAARAAEANDLLRLGGCVALSHLIRAAQQIVEVGGHALPRREGLELRLQLLGHELRHLAGH
eukprot:2353371-Prymnesium_polylepis.1